jgi:serine/threonine protein kinase
MQVVTDSSPELPQETEVGPYRLLAPIGRGGMAEVFLAEHRHLRQIRAVKVMLPGLCRRPEFVSRLLTEARATARLHHPAIIEIFDCDTLPSGGAFIAMQYLDGESLGTWLDRAGSLRDQPLLAAAIIGVVADALAYAHTQGVVHRDVKPDNLFLLPHPTLTRAFSLKVLDFGIAKLVGEAPLITTKAGCVVGTPDFMAPEQWQAGAAVDQRTDIYALGCVLLELLCGRPPATPADQLAVLRAQLTESPRMLKRHVPAVPAALARLLAQMLARAPADRPATMEEVLLALEAVLGRPRTGFAGLLRIPPQFPPLTGALSPDVRPPSGAPAAETDVAPPQETEARVRSYPRLRIAGIAAGVVGLLAVTAVLVAYLAGGDAPELEVRAHAAPRERAVAPSVRAAPPPSIVTAPAVVPPPPQAPPPPVAAPLTRTLSPSVVAPPVAPPARRSRPPRPSGNVYRAVAD